MRIRLLFLISLTLACSLFTPEAPPLDTRPADFSVRYDWYEGSLPPPYHYEYAISVDSSGAGSVEMVPDYPSQGVPVWTEPFTVEPAALDALYAQLASAGAFTSQWRAEDDPPVGGSYASTQITAQGQTITIPSFVVSGQAAAQGQIADAIRAVVPQDIWDRLEAQREQYVEENGG